MASYEILVPEYEGYQEAQEAFAIDPEELALMGLQMIGSVADRYIKRYAVNDNYGYVAPISRQGRSYWLRGLYLHENEAYDPIGIPRRPEELPGHLAWHNTELKRLASHGFSVVQHLPVVVKDEDRWGEAGYGVFTIAEHTDGKSLTSSLHSRLARKQQPAQQALEQLLAYYQDPERPKDDHYIRDICYMRQYIGHCLIDVDPLKADTEFPNELAYLTAEASKLRSKEGKRLHADINAVWMSQLNIVLQS